LRGEGELIFAGDRAAAADETIEAVARIAGAIALFSTAMLAPAMADPVTGR